MSLRRRGDCCKQYMPRPGAVDPGAGLPHVTSPFDLRLPRGARMPSKNDRLGDHVCDEPRNHDDRNDFDFE